jgi:hypothetical protein
MSIQAVLAPLFVQVALTFILLFSMAAVRTSAIRRREVKMADIALGQPAWGERATKLGNAFRNQLELPVLFYVLVVLALAARKADLLFVIMSWLFVISRLVHAAIHTGSNYVPRRFYAFAVGAIVLLLMWIIFALRVVLGLG